VGPVTALATEVFLGDPTRFANAATWNTALLHSGSALRSLRTLLYKMQPRCLRRSSRFDKSLSAISSNFR
jgi:hypothetical protein